MDAVDKAVEDWLLMERKARAWDKLREWYQDLDPQVVDVMDDLLEDQPDFVHPASATPIR